MLGAVHVGDWQHPAPRKHSLKKTEVTGRCLSPPGQGGGLGRGWVKRQGAGWDQHHSCVEAEGLREPKSGI